MAKFEVCRAPRKAYRMNAPAVLVLLIRGNVSPHVLRGGRGSTYVPRFNPSSPGDEGDECIGRRGV